MKRNQIVFLIKLAISVGIIVAIYGGVMKREGSEELTSRLSQISWPWLIAAVGMQLCAIAAAVVRWDKLLRGQGIRAPLRHLTGSFMIGRFFGAFTPAGLGLQGYKLYDIATQTGKTARSTACIGIEMVLGQLAFGAVVVGASIFGLRFLGVQGVIMVDTFFIGLISIAIVLITKPALFRLVASYLPKAFQSRLQTTVDAVCAYEGKGFLVAQAALLGMLIHAFNNLIYVCTARALGADLGVGEVFFASALQIFSTLLPASINGIGLREATAQALYTSVGVPSSLAILIPTVGFAVEMSVSSIGGLLFMLRRVGYKVDIEVDDAEHEDVVHAQVEEVDREMQPRIGRGTAIGLAAGAVGGALIGIGESIAILGGSSGTPDFGVFGYGVMSYALLFGGAGFGMGLVLAISGRILKREAVAEHLAFARGAALISALGALALGAFRIRRDLFREELVWKSGMGLGVLLGCLVSAALVYVVVSMGLAALARRKPLSLTFAGWLGPIATVAVFAVAGIVSIAAQPADAAQIGRTTTAAKKTAPSQAGNVMLIVVDTLRADRLPMYGYAKGKTPSLDEFAKDAVRYEWAFANSSWTRPSFASIMTGRYASSHATMAKPDSLPDEIVTLAEAFQSNGYTTRGVVTNFNVGPFFNFHQGFDEYRFLEPNFVLGANDTASKLLLAQFLRQRVTAYQESQGQVARGGAYQDAEVVNRDVLGFIDSKPAGPWYVFAAYMDPHDPYFPHPYDGTGFSRAANQHPDPKLAPELSRLYDGEITFWDQHFGSLIAELKKRGLYDDLTIVITSDHGEEFMEHGGFWHGTTLYDEQVHVPLVVKYPRQDKGGSVARQWVQSIDIMPTLLKRAGIAVPKGTQGAGLDETTGAAFAEENHEGNVLRALRMRRAGAEVKVIEANPGNPRGLEPFELYRMDQDPEEKVNLAKNDEELLKVAARELDARAKAATAGRASKRAVEVKAGSAAEEKLRALGYVE